MTLKEWIENDKRVMYEFEHLLERMDITIGSMSELRFMIDTIVANKD